MRIGTFRVFLAALLAAASVAAAARAPTAGAAAGEQAPPVFPDAYSVEWDFSIPYIEVLQPQGLK
jgi:hypothetical protein